jgi:hypothetical protein
MKKEAAHLAEDCPCTLLTCTIRGNCVECVRVHRVNKEHLPECMHDVLRDHIAALAKQVELGVVEQRPHPEQRDERAQESETG